MELKKSSFEFVGFTRKWIGSRQKMTEFLMNEIDENLSRGNSFGVSVDIDGDGTVVTVTVTPKFTNNPDPTKSPADAYVTTEHQETMKDIVGHATRELEKDLIQRALKHTNCNVIHAARMLKISRKSLMIKMKEYGMR